MYGGHTRRVLSAVFCKQNQCYVVNRHTSQAGGVATHCIYILEVPGSYYKWEMEREMKHIR
jgi:hypothetical protein